MSEKHTPLPWFAKTDGLPDDPAFPCIWKVGPDGEEKIRLIADTLGTMKECQGNAKFIVRACNAHYPMVSTLAFISSVIAINSGFNEPWAKKIQDRIDKALAMAVVETDDQAEGAVKT